MLLWNMKLTRQLAWLNYEVTFYFQAILIVNFTLLPPRIIDVTK